MVSPTSPALLLVLALPCFLFCPGGSRGRGLPSPWGCFVAPSRGALLSQGALSCSGARRTPSPCSQAGPAASPVTWAMHCSSGAKFVWTNMTVMGEGLGRECPCCLGAAAPLPCPFPLLGLCKPFVAQLEFFLAPVSAGMGSAGMGSAGMGFVLPAETPRGQAGVGTHGCGCQAACRTEQAACAGVPGSAQGWRRAGIRHGWVLALFLICSIFLPSGWEGIWNWGTRLGKDQRFLLVAGDCRLLQSHVQAPGSLGHAMGAVVWRWEVLRGKPAASPGWGWAEVSSSCSLCPFLGLLLCPVGCVCPPAASPGQGSSAFCLERRLWGALAALVPVTSA